MQLGSSVVQAPRATADDGQRGVPASAPAHVHCRLLHESDADMASIAASQMRVAVRTPSNGPAIDDPLGTFARGIRMRSMRLLLFLVLAACSAADVTDVAPVASNDDHDAAMALAKSCIQKNGYSTVWGTPLVPEKFTATHIEARKWVVGGPESGIGKDGKPVVLGLPMGLMIDVDLDAKTCRQMMLE